MTIIDLYKTDRGARVVRAARCRMRARQRTAQAEREPQSRAHHLDAARTWLLLATQLEQLNAGIRSSKKGAVDH